jgi:hypothetical protein
MQLEFKPFFIALFEGVEGLYQYIWKSETTEVFDFRRTEVCRGGGDMASYIVGLFYLLFLRTLGIV